MVDDLTTNILVGATQERLGDTATAAIAAHPNIELRVFNPWRQRTLVGQLLESIQHLDRVNQRMHNKLLIADNRAVILGGRNIGNERSEERRVGKEGVSTGSSRWSPDH